MINKLKGLFMEEEGQGMTEYGLILGLIAVAVIAVLVTFSGQIVSVFENLISKLPTGGTAASGTTSGA